MVGDEDYSNVIVCRKLGMQTGDVLYQTADGRWWGKWKGCDIKTGEEIKKIRKGQLVDL